MGYLGQLLLESLVAIFVICIVGGVIKFAITGRKKK